MDQLVFKSHNCSLNYSTGMLPSVPGVGSHYQLTAYFGYYSSVLLRLLQPGDKLQYKNHFHKTCDPMMCSVHCWKAASTIRQHCGFIIFVKHSQNTPLIKCLESDPSLNGLLNKEAAICCGGMFYLLSTIGRWRGTQSHPRWDQTC